MQITELQPGCASWRAEISKTLRNWKAFKVVMGYIPVENLDAGQDVEEFVSEVWREIGCDGCMSMTISLAGGDTVWVTSECDDGVAEVTSYSHNAEVCPVGLTGPWVLEEGCCG